MEKSKATIDAFRDPETGRYLVLDPTSRDCECLGAGMALAGLENTLFLQHAPIGCQFNKAIRHAAQGTLPMWASSLLTEKESVFGGEERLAQSLEKAYEVYRPAAIALVSACMPELIGDDVENVARQVESRLGIPIFPVRLAGFRGDHHTGYRKAVRAALERFVPARQTAGPVPPTDAEIHPQGAGIFPGDRPLRSVTLAGFSPLEHKARADLAELKRILERLGLTIHCTLMGEKRIEELGRAAESALTVVLCEVMGLEAAQYLQEHHGIPYLVPPPPYGIEGTSEWVRQIARSLGLEAEAEGVISEEEKAAYACLEPAGFGFVLLPGFPFVIRANPLGAVGITRYLMREHQMLPLAILSTGGDPVRERLEAVAQEVPLPFSPEILVDACFLEMKNAYLQSIQRFREMTLGEGMPILMGSSYEAVALTQCYLAGPPPKTLLPFVRVCAPVFDQFELSPAPYMGYRGAVVLLQDVLNGALTQLFPRAAVIQPWATREVGR